MVICDEGSRYVLRGENGDTSLISALNQAVSNVKKCSFSIVILAVGRLIPLKEVVPRDMLS